MDKLYTRNNELLRLFHICVDDEYKITSDAYELLKYGVAFVDEDGNLVREISRHLYNAGKSMFGLSNEMWKNTFHKSYEHVAETSMEELVAEQLVHYFSTYGLEKMGFRAMPYVPVEELHLDLEASANKRGFTFIRLVSEKTAIEYINDYFKRTRAPNIMLMDYILDLIPYTTLKPEEIASFELKMARYDEMGLVPTEGADFLRFMIYKVKCGTMLIKSDEVIQHIKSNAFFYPLIYKYFDCANLEKLAEVFYRFKPLFLAFKSYEYCGPYINKIRRLAVKYHKPMNDVNIQNISKLFNEGRVDDVEKVLAKASNRQLVKLYNYFCNLVKTSGKDASLYNIRNGKSYINAETAERDKVEDGCRLAVIWAELHSRFRNTLKGKTFLIPSYIDYAVPYSEKQFVDFIPYGTKIKRPTDKAFSVAIAWENYKGIRTDIDLHLNNATKSYGWNSSYKDDENAIIYSGDMTDATTGAVEAFYFNPKGEKFILSANNFTGRNGVPFKMLMTEKQFPQYASWSLKTQTAPIDISSAIFPPIELKFKDTSSMNIGVFDENGDFVFYGGSFNNRIVPDRKMCAMGTDALVNRSKNVLSMSLLLRLAGATVIDETQLPEEEEKRAEIIDLSPACLNLTSLLEIVDQN